MFTVKQCYQTGQLLIGQKMVENAKVKKLECDIPVVKSSLKMANFDEFLKT